MVYVDRKLLPEKITENYAHQKYYGKTGKIKSKSGKFKKIYIEEPLVGKSMNYKRLNQNKKYYFFKIYILHSSDPSLILSCHISYNLFIIFRFLQIILYLSFIALSLLSI